MNYRHAFHAGNHADVLKHFVLCRILALLSRKDTAFAYLDSHAGIGCYDLHSDQAERTGEWQTGIGRLWSASTSVPEPLQPYMRAVGEMNPDGRLRYYPGSPWLARCLCREQDRLYLNEKHPEDGLLLKQNMADDRRIAVHLREGWQIPKALLPTREKRAFLLIDPPFEQPDEHLHCVQALSDALKRMRQAIVGIWYPIKDKRQLRRFYHGLQNSGAEKLLRVELYIRPADDDQRLNGSGLVIANPPWGLEEELREVLPWLTQQLSADDGGWQLDWLVTECQMPSRGGR